jgi:hypothetical protein
VMEKGLVAALALVASVMVITTPVVVAAVVGVPVIAPVEELRLNPPGSAVPVDVKVHGVAPHVEVIDRENDAPTLVVWLVGVVAVERANAEVANPTVSPDAIKATTAM